MLLQGDSDNEEEEDLDYQSEEFVEGQFSDAEEGNMVSDSNSPHFSFQADTRSKSPSVSQLRNLDNVV